ncbi:MULTISPECIES: DUF4160 domain-containing protein [Pseudomonadati]
MPTLFREGPCRFFFYSDESDPREPPHVHVRAGDQVEFLEAWHAHFES